MAAGPEWLGDEADVTQARPLDLSVPSVERQHELAQAFQRSDDPLAAPYAGVEIRSHGELDWIIHQRGWRGEASRRDSDRVNMARAALRRVALDGMYLRNADFTEADLYSTRLAGAYLEGAIFQWATLERGDASAAILERADLRDAMLRRAVLDDAYLVRANLAGANLNRSRLRNADLTRANLRGADLRGADLRGAVLVGVEMDSSTDLTDIRIDRHTKLGGIDWAGVHLARVRWRDAPVLGDEPTFGQHHSRHKTSRERGQMFRKAHRAYHSLEIALREQGLSTAASNYRLGERRMERLALFQERRIAAWFLSGLLNVVAGYGERPSRAVLAYLNVIGLFADAYLLVTRLDGSGYPALNGLQALILSIISFHGRGFFEPVPTVGDPVSLVAALEAVLGLVIEIMFIVTFTRRFLGD